MKNIQSLLVSALAACAVAAAGPALGQATPSGPEFQVNTYATGYQQYPRITPGASGGFVVVWESPQDGFGLGILGQRYASDGSPLGAEFQVNTYTTNTQNRPVVAVDATGNFVVAWESAAQDNAYWTIRAQRFASSGAPLGAEFRVDASAYAHHLFPAAAADALGGFVVLWQGADASSDGVFGQRFASSGAALGAAFQVNTYTQQDQGFPSVAALPSGGFVAVWQGDLEDGSGFGVFGQRFASTGAPLGVEFRVNTSTTGNQDRPSVASGSSGGFVVVWHGPDGSGYGIFGQRFTSAGAPAGGEFQVNTNTLGDQVFAAVSTDPSGNFAVVWQSSGQDGSDWGVFGQRFASAGAPLGGEFLVNSFTTGFQNDPAAAVTASGSFAVVWSSALQDGSSLGVFSQRYGNVVPVELIRFTAD